MSRISLRRVMGILVVGLLLIVCARFVGLGGRFYMGDFMLLLGLLLCFASLFIGVYGHLLPALRSGTARIYRVLGMNTSD